MFEWETFLLSFVITTFVGFLSIWLFRRWALKTAQQEAQEILRDAHQELEIVELDITEKQAELEQEIFAPHEKQLAQLEEKIEHLDADIQAQQIELEQIKEKLNQSYRQRQSQVDSYDHRVKEQAQQLEKLKEQKIQEHLNFKAQLQKKVNLNTPEELNRLMQMEISLWETHYIKWIKDHESQTQDQVEPLAKKMLSRVLIRFHRTYCSERGIPYVELPQDKPDYRLKVTSDNSWVTPLISEISGCDIIVDPELDYIPVGGFDSVRRELARRILERALRDKQNLTKERVLQFADNIKRELLSQIKRDGDLLTKELGLQNVAVEIRKMMGSLRYRYSFTQNQYFHCAEVGFLAGLIASELGGIDLKKGRRAGLLHDLGKAMDHEFDGGHAVIGANFIEQHGEAPDVVHAVRAHHYDETPSTLLAYAVIAADAISGARPGARRSTVESYTQKINDLENIARSFKGVTDCIVLNGGRECRLKVDSHRIDDLSAAQIAREVTKRIESECSYPGQIKVVVVRESYASESKSQRHHNQK